MLNQKQIFFSMRAVMHKQLFITESYLGSGRTLMMEPFAKIVNGKTWLPIFAKKLHRRYLIRFLNTPLHNVLTIHTDLTSKKQPFADVLQNRCSWKFHNIHRKTLVFESLFNKVAGLLLKRDFNTGVFLWILLNFKNSFF